MHHTVTNPFPTALLSILNKIGNPSAEFLSDLHQLLKYEKIVKNEKWLANGHICRKVIFLESGFMYSVLEEENRTVTARFMKENDFILTVESFLTQSPSTETIITIEDTSGWYITYTELRMLLEKHVCFLRIYLLLIEHYYVLSEK